MRQTAEGAKGHLTEEHRSNVERLIEVIDVFVELRRNIPAYQIVAFLRIALDEGRSVKHHSTINELSSSTTSRALLDLGKMNKKREPGMMLIEEKPSTRNLREHEMYLTPKGRALISKISSKLRV